MNSIGSTLKRRIILFPIRGIDREGLSLLLLGLLGSVAVVLVNIPVKEWLATDQRAKQKHETY